jgi:hypothetical protein
LGNPYRLGHGRVCSIAAVVFFSFIDFRQKLAQFRAGSRLQMVTTKAEREPHQAEFAEVTRAASADVLSIEIQAPR